MPTLNPRISITLKPSTYSLMRELSSLTGNSMSSILSELIDVNEPVFFRMVTVLTAAKKAQDESRASMVDAITKAQSSIESQLGLALDSLDDDLMPLLAQAEEVRRRGRMGSPATGDSASAAVPTPPSNRGVRYTVTPREATRKGPHHGQV